MSTISYHFTAEKDIHHSVEGILAFAKEYNKDFVPELETQLREGLHTYIKESLAQKSFIACYALSDGKLAGVGAIYLRQQPPTVKNLSGKWAYVFSMYTYPQFRKKGIARNILELLMEKGREMGVKTFELHATPDGEPVYQKQGFILFPEPTYRIHSA